MRVIDAPCARDSGFGLLWGSVGGLKRTVWVRIVGIGTREEGGCRMNQFWLIRGIERML